MAAVVLLLAALALLVAAVVLVAFVTSRRQGPAPATSGPPQVDALVSGSGHGGADLSALADQITNPQTEPLEGNTP
jgi:hypothetical protein